MKKKSWTPIWITSLILFVLGAGLVIGARLSGADATSISPQDIREELSTVEVVDTSESFERRDVSSLSIDIAAAKVSVIPGEKYSVSAKNIPENTLENYESEGILYISQSDSYYSNKKFGEWLGNNLGWIDLEPEIVITVPAGEKLDNFEINISVGKCFLDSIEAEQMDIFLDVGDLEVKSADVDSLEVYTAAGNINFSGNFNESASINCDVGSVSMHLSGSEEDYTMELDIPLGSVRIGGSEKYQGGERTIGNGEKYLDLSVDVGGADIYFNN